MATTEENVIRVLRSLPDEKQQEVLDFAQWLQERTSQRTAMRDIAGLWSGLGEPTTEQDIAELRAEMWKNFPREDI